MEEESRMKTNPILEQDMDEGAQRRRGGKPRHGGGPTPRESPQESQHSSECSSSPYAGEGPPTQSQNILVQEGDPEVALSRRAAVAGRGGNIQRSSDPLLEG